MSAACAPWLSVIMPVHRGERWIAAALESLVCQADEGIEVLVLDSSPEPGTLEIVRRYADRLRLRVLDVGGVTAWHAKTNLAATAAAAPHLCWLHQDDLWLPGRAAAVRAWIADAPDAVLYLSPVAIVDGDGRTLGLWRCPLGAGVVDPTRLRDRLLVQNFIAAPAPVYRRDAALRCGGLDEDLWYSADWDFWLNLAALGPVHHHALVTAAFRVHGSSLTVTGSRDAADFRQQMAAVLDRHLPRRGARALRRACLASVAVNAALAAASAGDRRSLFPAAMRLLALGPGGLLRYLHASRIAERVLPRLRAKLAGSF